MRRTLTFAACLLSITCSSLLYADSSCDNDCCSTACDSSPSFFSGNGCSKGFYFGAEATYLAPLYDESVATFTLTDVFNDAGVSLQSDFDSAEELTGAPRIVIGYAGDHGLGIQARYWELSSSTTQNDLPLPVLGSQLQTLGGEDRFNAYTIDLELTKAFCHHGWNMLGTLGVRYGSIDHQRAERATGGVFIGGPIDVFHMGARTGEEFHGTGLTFSLSGLKTLIPRSGLAFYTSARGSTLWGSAQTSALTYSTFSGQFGQTGSVNGAIDTNDETMFIGELGAGLQWSRCVNNHSGRMFARAGVEYQYWGTSNGFAYAASTSGTALLSNGTVTALGGNQETHLVGLALMAGYAW